MHGLFSLLRWHFKVHLFLLAIIQNAYVIVIGRVLYSMYMHSHLSSVSYAFSIWKAQGMVYIQRASLKSKPVFVIRFIS